MMKSLLKSHLFKPLVFFADVKPKKHSQWIYSTQHEQMKMQVGKFGKIYIYSHLSSDTHDASLRFINVLNECNMILTTQLDFTHRYMKALNQKSRFVDDDKGSEGQKMMVELNESKSIAEFKEPQNTHQFNAQIQTSKYVELEKEYATNSQQIDLNQIQKLKDYMNLKNFKQKLQQEKHEKGYPPIFSINEELNSLKEWQKDGLNVLCLFKAQDIKQCGKAIEYLQAQSLRYEIMPSSDQLITAIVSSGIPADRFSLEYNPASIHELLLRRKNMKITVCISIDSERAEHLISKVCEIYGKDQVIYIHHPENYFRGEAYKAIEYINKREAKSAKMQVILSPFIAQFNEEVKDQIDKRAHIFGEFISSNLNLIELQQLDKKLQEMDAKSYVMEADSYLMAAQMLAKIKSQEKVLQCLRKIFPKKSEQKLSKMVEEGKKRVSYDYIGLK